MVAISLSEVISQSRIANQVLAPTETASKSKLYFSESKPPLNNWRYGSEIEISVRIHTNTNTVGSNVLHPTGSKLCRNDLDGRSEMK
jgi:hypothetical protein